MARLALLGSALLVLGACAHVDTGQIDYRIADNAPVVDWKVEASKCSKGATCEPLLPVPLQRKYVPDQSEAGRPFKAKEVYSIDIEQGMMGSRLLEGNFFGKEVGRAGEFAILANVFEFASQEADAAKRRFLNGPQLGAPDDPSDIELKLVYFSDDVRRHQPFNFSNIPLRPRTAYGGGSIGIQIVIMEVDAQSGPVASLLKTLARFGQQAVPGPPDVKDMIFDLGESLFTGGSQDDRLFEYRFVLSAPSDPNAVQAAFAPGRYVLRRMQVRDTQMSWKGLRLDQNTGRLYDGNQEARDELYLVLNIRRFPEGTAPEEYAFENWSAFRKLVQDAADAEGAPLEAVTRDFQEVLLSRRSDQWKGRVATRWATAQSELRYFERHYVADTIDNARLHQCSATPDALKRDRDIAEQQARDSLREFVLDYQAALKAGPTAETPNAPFEYSTNDREAATSMVARYFMPWQSPEQQGLFSSGSAFETAFFSDGAANDFIATALGVAKARGAALPAANCQDLVARGLATIVEG